MSANEYNCVICKKLISADDIAKRRYSYPSRPMPPASEMVCSRKCRVALRQRRGDFREMSKLGNASMKEQGIYQSKQRVAKIAKSNSEKPRRGKKG